MTAHRSAPRPVALLALAALVAVLPGLTSCGKKPAPPAAISEMPEPGGDAPLGSGQLKGARLGAIQSTTTWDFTGTRFTLVNRGGPLPANVAASVLGPGTTANRVVGDWRFDEQAGVIILSNMESDGQKVDATASLPIHAAGAVRANLGTEQYNIFPPDIVRRMDGPAAPPPVQR